MNTTPTNQLLIRVLVVEDQELIRESLEIILSNKPGIQVVGTASNGEDAVLLCQKLVPDIVLLDIRMPKMDGVTACKKSKSKTPALRSSFSPLLTTMSTFIMPFGMAPADIF